MPENGPQGIITGTLASFSDVDISRGYQNGDGVSFSEGTTSGWGYGLNARLGWRLGTPGGSITPFASYQLSHTALAGYNETNGPFPATISSIEASAQVGRVGVEGRLPVADASWLWGSAAFAYRLDDTATAVHGQLDGLFAVDANAAVPERDWGEFTAGLNFAASPTTRLTASATAYVNGATAAAVTGRGGVSIGF